jgi:hypothetical protein
VKPAKLKGTSIAFPAKMKGKFVTHTGGLKLSLGDKFLAREQHQAELQDRQGQRDRGQLHASARSRSRTSSTFKGGKNTIKKNGKWTGAKVAGREDQRPQRR